MYLTANLGLGPRYGLMTGLQSTTNLPMGWARSAIELTFVAIGWSLGGMVGVGVRPFAFGIGPSAAVSPYGFQLVFGNKLPQDKVL